MVPRSFDEKLLLLYSQLNLQSANDLSNEIDKITLKICEILQVERSSVWLYGSDNDYIRAISLYEATEKKHSRDQILLKKDYKPYFESMEHDRIIEASDAQSHKATSCFRDSYLKPQGIFSLYDAPIWKADRVIGVLCLEYLQPKNNWTDGERNFITSVADFLGKVFEKHIKKIELEEYKKEFNVISNRLIAGNPVIHVLAEKVDKTFKKIETVNKSICF